MRCLWLTLCHPDPQTNGQFLYSGGLIRAAAAAGIQVTALGLARNEVTAVRAEKNIQWELGSERRVSPLRWLVSPFPIASLKTAVPNLRSALVHHLSADDWDAIVLDSINVAWALPPVLRHRERFPRTRVLYVAQNLEARAVTERAKAHRGIKRALLLVEAAKTQRVERLLLSGVDLVTADSPDDCRVLGRHSSKPVTFLPPGYAGRKTERRVIDADVPRRAIVVGSFDWPAKRISLEAFLKAAAVPFAQAGISLQIVGRTEERYVAALRHRFPSIDVLGSVADVTPYLAGARIGLVPDVLGGFKLKTLDYIFSRTPIFAIEEAVPGLPLSNGSGLSLFKTHAELVGGVVGAIDDFDALNAQQDFAFRLCLEWFDWDRIGRSLHDLLTQRDANATVAPLRMDRRAR